MEISIFFAQFFGWYLVIMGIIILLRGRGFLGELFRLIEDKSFLLLAGYLTLFLGLGVVILHNVWVEDWRVIVTILGWLTLVKGVLLIGFPRNYAKLGSIFMKNPSLLRILMVITVLLGAGLIWLSY